MPKGTLIPQDFSVTSDHREYCERKWGHPALADVFFSSFFDYFALGDGVDSKHRDWDRTFKMWLQRSSPEGEFYNAYHWEKQIERAGKLEGRKRKPEPTPYHPQQVHKQREVPTMTEIAERELRKMREGLV